MRKFKDFDSKTFLFLFGIILLQFQCGSPDSYQELSGNYFYRGEGGEANEILSHTPKQKSIYGRITSYDFNDDFIIALQQPSYSSHKYMIAANLRTNGIKKISTNSSQEIAESEKIADSILKYNPFYQEIFYAKINFWIISNKPNKVYGPLNEKEYQKKRKELNIPESLTLDNE